jgi:hypothetical protein
MRPSLLHTWYVSPKHIHMQPLIPHTNPARTHLSSQKKNSTLTQLSSSSHICVAVPPAHACSTSARDRATSRASCTSSPQAATALGSQAARKPERERERASLSSASSTYRRCPRLRSGTSARTGSAMRWTSSRSCSSRATGDSVRRVSCLPPPPYLYQSGGNNKIKEVLKWRKWGGFFFGLLWGQTV